MIEQNKTATKQNSENKKANKQSERRRKKKENRASATPTSPGGRGESEAEGEAGSYESRVKQTQIMTVVLVRKTVMMEAGEAAGGVWDPSATAGGKRRRRRWREGAHEMRRTQPEGEGTPRPRGGSPHHRAHRFPV